MDSYKITLEAFDEQAQAYQDKFMDVDLYNDTYDLFCESLQPGASKVLETGCGPGNITKYIWSKKPGFKITATDVAPNMVRLAKRNNPTVNCEVLDCRHIDKILGKFDGIVCGFCLPYLSKEDCKKLLKDCYTLLNNGGIFYLSTIEGDYDTSGFESSSNGKYKAYVYYYSEDFLVSELQNNNFKLIKLFRKKYNQPGSTASTHLVIIAKKL